MIFYQHEQREAIKVAAGLIKQLRLIQAQMPQSVAIIFDQYHGKDTRPDLKELDLLLHGVKPDFD